MGRTSRMQRQWLLLVLVLLLGPVSRGFGLGRRRAGLKLLKIQKQLKNVNKPGVKTIRSPDGDLIDCVPAAAQPAFDHPKLRSHVLQLAPTAMLAELNKDDDQEAPPPVAQHWHQGGRCPKGTVPIRRTTIDDILRVGSISRYGRKYKSPPNPSNSTTTGRAGFSTESLRQIPEPIDSTGHEHAIAYMTGQFYGAQATLNVWKPGISVSDEFSLSQIWLLGGSFTNNLNSIEAGWQVSPELYGDNNPRLFTYWTSDSYQATGCYNLLCSGFIQTANNIAIGASIFPVSAFDGPQYDIKILVWKDPRTSNWWMRLGERALVGYWPAEIFSHLAGSATMIEWGGEVVNTRPGGGHTNTQMGSGRFPSQGFAEASYFRNLGVVDADNQLQTRLNLQTLAERPGCYNIQKANNPEWGNYFYYGGPGKNPSCQ